MVWTMRANKRQYVDLVHIIILMIGSAFNTAAFAEKFIIGVEDNRYLPHYAFENGEYKGFGRDVLDAFFQSANYDFKYRAFPVARLFRSFVNAEVDFKYPDNAMWSMALKQDKPIVYSDPVIAVIDGVNVLPENKNRGPENIKLLGTIRGFTTSNWLQRIKDETVILSENDSIILLIQQTIMGRIDGTYANIDVIQYLLNNTLKKPNALQFDPSLPHTRTHYHLSSIKHPEVIEEFNAWMKDNQDLILRIKQKYQLNNDETN